MDDAYKYELIKQLSFNKRPCSRNNDLDRMMVREEEIRRQLRDRVNIDLRDPIAVMDDDDDMKEKMLWKRPKRHQQHTHTKFGTIEVEIKRALRKASQSSNAAVYLSARSRNTPSNSVYIRHCVNAIKRAKEDFFNAWQLFQLMDEEEQWKGPRTKLLIEEAKQELHEIELHLLKQENQTDEEEECLKPRRTQIKNKS